MQQLACAPAGGVTLGPCLHKNRVSFFQKAEYLFINTMLSSLKLQIETKRVDLL